MVVCVCVCVCVDVQGKAIGGDCNHIFFKCT